MSYNETEMAYKNGYEKGYRDAKEERKKMSNKEWIDFLSEQFSISRTSARNMLHCMLKWKEWDNFKNSFGG